jgi:hypothetical protein
MHPGIAPIPIIPKITATAARDIALLSIDTLLMLADAHDDASGTRSTGSEVCGCKQSGQRA